MEPLERRNLLAQAVLVQHDFREDDFFISGTFSGVMVLPAQYTLRDTYNNSTYSSNSAHVTWTSPKDATGFFEGVAGGNGNIRVVSPSLPCADYTFRDTGQIDFRIFADNSNLLIENTTSTSTAYTSFSDRRPGGQSCAVPNPPPSRFFGGASGSYTGTFSPSTHTVSIDYAQSNPELTVTSPSTAVQWSDSSATDLALTIRPYPTEPDGWISVPQSVPPAATVDSIDPSQGLRFTVDVLGQPAKVSNVLAPVARVRLAWASSVGDTGGTEIPITSSGDPAALYWNSSQLNAIVEQFPTPPVGATHLRVWIDANAGTDANAANSSRYLPIVNFQAGNPSTSPIGEDDLLDARSESLLSAADQAQGNTRVLAYHPQSRLGAEVTVVDDRGGYLYDARQLAAVQALSPGESVQDQIDFLAIRNGTLRDFASRTVTLQGVNDPPLANGDSAATGNHTVLTLLPSQLLSNDEDIDQSDVLAIHAVSATSLRGAAVRLVLDAAQTNVLAVTYDPTASTDLGQLFVGEEVTDEFTYEVADRFGGMAVASVTVTVTGEMNLEILPVSPQYTMKNSVAGPIPIVLWDPDGDASEVQLSAAADNLALVPAGNTQVSGSGDTRSLLITPAAGMSGRTWMTLTASDALGRIARSGFWLVVGSDLDRDLDGVPDATENAAPNGGDMNQDGIPDSQQPDVASGRVRPGQAFFNLVVAVPYFLSQVAFSDSPAPSGEAANATFPDGLIAFEVLLYQPGATAEVTLRTDLASPALNRYFQYVSLPGGGGFWRNAMHDTAVGARMFTDLVDYSAVDGGEGDLDGVVDARVVGQGAPANVPQPWTNELLREDVNNDGGVTPEDVMILVAELNFGGFRYLGELPSWGQSLPPFLDPTGDGELTPQDPLWVINAINAGVGAEAEGESLAAAPPAAIPAGAAATITAATPVSVPGRAAHRQHAEPTPGSTLGDLQKTQRLSERDRFFGLLGTSSVRFAGIRQRFGSAASSPHRDKAIRESLRRAEPLIPLAEASEPLDEAGWFQRLGDEKTAGPSVAETVESLSDRECATYPY